MRNLSIEHLRKMRERYLWNGVSEVTAVLDELIAILELKGDQVPVGFAVMDENHDWHIDFCGKEHALSHGDSLFTAPQKPVVLPPLPAAIGDFTEAAMKAVRRMDIAAIEAAGGIVKDGE